MILVRENSSRLYYDLVGSRNKPVVCLLHSIAADSGMWADQAAALLARDFRVLRIDFPGHGGSSVPNTPLTPETLADDVIAVLDANEIKTCHLVGLSIGGVVGQALALDHGKRLMSLLVASATPKSSSEAAAAWQARINAVQKAGSLSPLGQGMIERWVSEAVKATDPQLWERTVQTILGTTAEGFIACAGLMRQFDFVQRLPSVRVPTLVVAGSDDQAIPPVMGKLIAECIPGARYQEIAGGRHVPNLEFPDLFNKLMIDWCAAHTEAVLV